MRTSTILAHKKCFNQLAEVGWEEKNTTNYIFQTLLPYQPLHKGFGTAKTGLLYKVGKGEDAILLRADIDALMTQKGVKHTCGHSSHAAGLLGALQDTIKKETELTLANKSIYFLFQPSEENYPSGAKAFIETTPELLSTIRYAFATHVRPLLPLGTIGLVPGPLWARGDYIEIEIEGKMVHVKDAPKGKDALEAAAHIILSVKALQKEYADILRINIGVVQGGFQANTIADKAILKGDIRMKENTLQKEIKKKLDDETKKIGHLVGVKIRLHYFDGYPVVKNDSQLTQKVHRYLKKQTDWRILSNDSLFSFGCEDFCFIAEKIPSVMALIGTGDKYDIHEAKCAISDNGTIVLYDYFSHIIDWWKTA